MPESGTLLFLLVITQRLSICTVAQVLVRDPLNVGRKKVDRTICKDELSSVARMPTEGTVIVDNLPGEGLGADGAVDDRRRLRLEKR